MPDDPQIPGSVIPMPLHNDCVFPPLAKPRTIHLCLSCGYIYSPEGYTIMNNEIERAIKGLIILQKYIPNAHLMTSSGVTHSIVFQDEALFELDREDEEALVLHGWRRDGDPYTWKLLTRRGLERENKSKS